jgi:hypothetical protein
MRSWFHHRRPSPATLISLIALFVALSGSAYAALSKDSVGSKQVKDESLVSKDLKDGKAVAAADVVDDSLTGKDLDEGTLGTVPAATSATSADNAAHATDADQLGGVAPGGYTRTQWALIGPNGDVIRQSGGVNEVNGGSGSFYVGFGSDVSGDAVQVTPVSQTADTGYGVSAVVASCADINCGPDLNSSYVFVRTSSGNGNVDNQGFYITVSR